MEYKDSLNDLVAGDTSAEDFEQGLIEILGCKRVDIRELKPIIDAFERWPGLPKNLGRRGTYHLRMKNDTGDPELDKWYATNTAFAQWFPDRQEWRLYGRFRSPEYVAERYAEARFAFWEDDI